MYKVKKRTFGKEEITNPAFDFDDVEFCDSGYAAVAISPSLGIIGINADNSLNSLKSESGFYRIRKGLNGHYYATGQGKIVVEVQHLLEKRLN